MLMVEERTMNEKLRLHLEQQDWDAIIESTENLDDHQSNQPATWFFRGAALLQTGHADLAIATVCRGLTLNHSSSWGNKLLFDALLANHQFDEALQSFQTFIRSEPGRESEKAWYVQRAAELGFLDAAGEMNETRDVICNVKPAPTHALALQCFCKADTLETVFNSLAKLEGIEGCSLVIIQDSDVDINAGARYQRGHKDVQNLISTWLPSMSSKFFSVELLQNDRNLGTAPTCRRLLDYVATKYEAFLFIEDDCNLSSTSVAWAFDQIGRRINPSGCWFVTCESSFFDREDRQISNEIKLRLRRIAVHDRIRDAVCLLNYVPSTCFGTTSTIWRLCRGPRSFTRGPESLSMFVAREGHKIISPVVPRASDVGMLHELGYSFSRVGSNVREKKNTVLMACHAVVPDNSSEYEGDLDLLYAATSKLDPTALSELEAILNINEPIGLRGDAEAG